MKRLCTYILPVAVLSIFGGCSSGENDSLAREKASMEAEAKALAAHKTQPADAPAAGRVGSVPSPGQPGSQTGSRLPAGTAVKIVTTQSLSTRSAATGQEWTGRLSEDLKDSAGAVLAQAGSDVRGRVVLASDGSNIRRKHELEVRVYRLNSVSGKPVDIRTTSFVKPGAEEGRRPAIIESQMAIEFKLASEAVFP